MPLALTTHWNAHRHTCGERMVDEILDLGFRHIELGYDLRLDLVPGVLKRVKENAIHVTSVHNYCPVPIGAPGGHPELFLFSSRDARQRSSAVLHTLNTIRFAAEMGASCVVVHAGRVDMRHYTAKLIDYAERGQQDSLRYEKLKQKVLLKRDQKKKRHLDLVRACLAEILPQLESTGLVMGLENLPSWEAIPSEVEMEELAREFHSPHLGFWYDVGHGQIRQNLGLVSTLRWLERLQPHLVGMHLHDVKPPAMDHVMPPFGSVNFEMLRRFFSPALPLVIEPAPGTPAELVSGALLFLRELMERSKEMTVKAEVQ
jgi:sugar phosphate isomerase/epimerase